MDKKLRLFTAAIIMSSKIDNPAKRTLLKFVKEKATNSQLKAFLMDGRLDKLDEQAEDIVSERFESKTELKKKILEFDPGTFYVGMVATVFAAVAAKIAFNVARNILNKAHKACKQYTGSEKQRCLTKFRVEAAKKQIESLNISKGKCKTTKNPEKCVALINKKILKLQKKATQIIP